MALNQIKVLIADGNNAVANKLSSYLRDSGFDTKVVNNNYLLPKTIMEWRPHFLFIDMLFPGFYAQKALKFLNERKLLGPEGIRVIVMSKHNAEINVMSCLEAGADDFLVKPLQLIEVLHRLALLSRSQKYTFAPIMKSNDNKIQYYFQMIELLIEAAGQNKANHPLRFDLINMLSIALKAVRTTVYVCNSDKTKVKVNASSDDENFTNVAIDLTKYPELQYVLRTEKSLFIESIEKDLTMAFVKDHVKTIQFSSMIILPIMDHGKLVGCLSIRMPKDRKKHSIWDIRIAQIACQLIGMTWKFKNPSSEKSAA